MILKCLRKSRKYSLKRIIESACSVTAVIILSTTISLGVPSKYLNDSNREGDGMETVMIFMLIFVLASFYVVFRKIQEIEDLIMNKGGQHGKAIEVYG